MSSEIDMRLAMFATNVRIRREQVEGRMSTNCVELILTQNGPLGPTLVDSDATVPSQGR